MKTTLNADMELLKLTCEELLNNKHLLKKGQHRMTSIAVYKRNFHNISGLKPTIKNIETILKTL